MIKLLLQNEARVFRNSYLKTRRQILIALALLIGFYLLFVRPLAWMFVGFMRQLVGDLPPEQVMQVITPHFYGILLGFFIVSFLFMMREAAFMLYHSPELSLLVSTPIPVNTLFIFRFMLLAFFSVGVWSFVLVLPPLIAIGIATAAPWYYYLFILPAVCLLTLISASLISPLVMLLARVLSPKKIMMITVVFGLLGGFLVIGLMGVDKEVPELLERMMAAELFWDVMFPLSDAARVLSGLVQGEIELWRLLRLFLAGGITLAGCMLAARRLYHEGYERSQVVEITAGRRVDRPAREPLFLGRRSNLILTEWKKAVRNYGMVQEAVVYLFMLLWYLFMLRGVAPPEPWDGLLLLLHVAVVGFLGSSTVEPFFTPAAARQDRKLLKEQYSVLKAAPFVGREFILSHWLAPFIPRILLSGTILLVLNILMGNSMLIILLSLVVLALLVGSASAFSLMIDMIAYGTQSETTSLLHRVLRVILPMLYYWHAPMILIPGLLVSGVVIPVSIVAFLVVVGLTSYCSFRFGAKYWERMEI